MLVPNLKYKSMKNKDCWRKSILNLRIVSIMLFALLVYAPFEVKSESSQTNQMKQDSVAYYLLKGKIRDEKGVPLPGVTVRLDSTIIGTSSDNNGNYRMNLPVNKGRLVFSFIGYKTRMISFTLIDTVLNVIMEEDVSELDEVQVIAYGESSKRNSIGSMSLVKADDFKNIPSPSINNLLQGRVAGMSVVNSTGAPGGGGTQITIRGFNSLSSEKGRITSEPLWVIDGVPMYSFTSPVTGLNTLAEIDPNDIETVQVLKDAASAAIYGSRAANGVILVTTKKGREGKTKFMVNVSQTFVINPSIPDLTTGNRERRHRMEALMNYRERVFDESTNSYRPVESFDEAYRSAMQYNYFWNRDGLDIPVLQDSLNSFYNNSTDLFDYYFRNGKVTDASLQVSGGSKTVLYNIGLGYYTETGVLRNTGFNRVKLLSNMTFKPFAKIEGNLRFYLARTGRNRSSKGRDPFNFTDLRGGDLETIPDELLTTSTLLPGPGTPAFEETIKRFNETKEKNDSYRLRASFDLGWQVTSWLKLKSSLAVDYSQQNQNIFMPSELSDYNESYSSGQVGRSMMWLNENLLSLRKGFGDHYFDALLGLSFQGDQMNTIGGYGKGAPSDLIHYVTWNGNAYDLNNKRQLKEFSSGIEKSTMVGVFGRISYNYLQKYYFSMTIRRDASSKFGENTRWGTFPSFALGYTFTGEPYMNWARGFLDYGKIRASYGKSGRQFESPYLAFGVLTTGTTTFQGNQTIAPYWYSGLINPKLSWEETKQYDLGLDLDFFNHKIGIVLDYYYRYTDKLLTLMSLPGDYNAYSQQWQNAYAISNQGIEFQLKMDLMRTEKISWDLTFNIARNWNRLEKSNDGMDFTNNVSPDNVSVIGKPLNGIYVFDDRGMYGDAREVPLYHVNGKISPLGYANQVYTAGDRIIRDNDGNGEISKQPPLKEDRVYAGSPLPLASGGIISSLSWKGLEVNVLFAYMLGRHVLNAGEGASVGTINQINSGDMITPIFADLDKITFWKQAAAKADYPANRLENGLNNFSTNLASNVEKISYLKLKTLTIGYTLPSKWMRNTGVNVRVFVAGENLFTITNYGGPDPESIDVVTGIDSFNNYPLARKITMGLTLNF